MAAQCCAEAPLLMSFGINCFPTEGGGPKRLPITLVLSSKLGNLEIQKFGIPWNPCDKDFRSLDLLEPLRQRFPDFQTPPPAPPLAPEEFSDHNLIPLPTHPGIK